MRRVASSRSLPLLLALATVTCQRVTPATEGTQDPTDAPAKPRPGDVGDAPTPAADPTHPLELVPARARAMLMVRSPQRAAQIWERERFQGRFPAEYETLVGEMKKELGHDLLDPSALAAIGIDPTAPVGVAMLSAEDEAFMVFGGTGNPEALLGLFRRATGKELPAQAVGPAKLVRVDEEVSLVLRHGMFAIVLVDRHRNGRLDYAHEIARIDPAQSLAHASAMERAHAGLPQEADVRALLDVGGLIRDELERSKVREQEMIGETNRRVAEARQRGASTEEIARLQQDVQHEQEFVRRRQRERQMAELLLARTFGAIEGIGLAVDADAARGLVGQIHLALGSDAMFRDLFVSSDRPPTAILAQGDAPQLVLSAQVDPAVAVDLLAQGALAVGTTYADINDEVLRDLRVDFDRAVRPLLDGRATFVLTAVPKLDPKRAKDVEEALGGMLAIGVTDETKARALLDEVVAEHAEHRLTRAPEIFGWTLARADHPRAFHFGVVAGQLVVGTDMAAIRRLRDGQAGPAGTRYPDPEPWQRLTEGSGVGRVALHQRLPLSLAFAFMNAFDGIEFPHNPDHQLASEFPEADVFSIPRSAATLRAEKQRDAAYEARNVEVERTRGQRRIAAWNKADALGITAGVVREVETGLLVEGGHYVAGGPFGYAEAIVGLAGAAKAGKDPGQERARDRLDRLEARVLDLRRKDVVRELAKRGSPPAATP